MADSRDNEKEWDLVEKKEQKDRGCGEEIREVGI